MSEIYHDLTELIGRTPLVEVVNMERALGLAARLLVKIEGFNPGGSVKDRAALSMIDDAERRGWLRPGGVIVEPTSGNTGIGLAWIAGVRGYRIILTMPESMSAERRKLLRLLGAKLVLTPAAEGMDGAIRRARELQRQTPGAFMPGQFDNPANPAAHEAATAEEIWAGTDGAVDIFVAGVGTGGTLSGTARGLKRRKPGVVAVGVEPAGSPVLSGGQAGTHRLQGIGAGFVPGNYDATVVDAVVAVTDEEAVRAAHLLARREGVMAGISSGAALHAAIELARREENRGKVIVALLPDTGERYLSTLLCDYEALPD